VRGAAGVDDDSGVLARAEVDRGLRTGGRGDQQRERECE
jgi:hypothetical protein